MITEIEEEIAQFSQEIRDALLARGIHSTDAIVKPCATAVMNGMALLDGDYPGHLEKITDWPTVVRDERIDVAVASPYAVVVSRCELDIMKRKLTDAINAQCGFILIHIPGAKPEDVRVVLNDAWMQGIRKRNTERYFS